MSPPSQPIRLPAKPGRPVPLRFLETTDSLRIVAGSARRPALFPQLFPIPDPGRHLGRQRESELMREHTHLPAMVGFVGKHVAQHFQANRPRRSPTVSAKLLDAAPTTAERFSEHLRAASGALGQSRTGLLRRAVRDRKSTRLNSSHVAISYAVFCLKKKKRSKITKKLQSLINLLIHKNLILSLRVLKWIQSLPMSMVTN